MWVLVLVVTEPWLLILLKSELTEPRPLWSPTEATATGLTGPRHVRSRLSGDRTMGTGPTETRATESGLTGPRRGFFPIVLVVTESWVLNESHDHCLYTSRAVASGLTRTRTMASGCTGQEPQQHKDWMDSRNQNLLMDREVAKETRDAPIRQSRADVIGIVQSGSDSWPDETPTTVIHIKVLPHWSKTLRYQLLVPPWGSVGNTWTLHVWVTGRSLDEFWVKVPPGLRVEVGCVEAEEEQRLQLNVQS